MALRRPPIWLILRAGAILLVSGLAGATLVRIAPGFGSDERALDVRLSSASVRAIQEQRAQENPLVFYVRFLSGLIRGNAGQSVVYGRPVAQLIRERAPVTIRSVAFGLIIGWGAAVLLALATVFGRVPGVALAMALTVTLVSIPSAVLATLCLLVQLPPAVAIAAVVLPRVFPYIHEQLRSNWAAPHVIMARAKGLHEGWIFLYHVVPPTLLPLLALAGVSVTLAFGASIPVEALADSPGIGQLAWRAALGRDLPVLVTITLLLTAITVFVNVLADIVPGRLGRERL